VWVPLLLITGCGVVAKRIKTKKRVNSTTDMAIFSFNRYLKIKLDKKLRLYDFYVQLHVETVMTMLNV